MSAWTKEPWPECAADHEWSALSEDVNGVRRKEVALSEPDYERAARCTNSLAGIPDPANAIEGILTALREIAAKKGPFSRDPETHARNCIEAMAEHARAALALLEPKNTPTTSAGDNKGKAR